MFSIHSRVSFCSQRGLPFHNAMGRQTPPPPPPKKGRPPPRYGQQADGTHPTGMHTCCSCSSVHGRVASQHASLVTLQGSLCLEGERGVCLWREVGPAYEGEGVCLWREGVCIEGFGRPPPPRYYGTYHTGIRSCTLMLPPISYLK